MKKDVVEDHKRKMVRKKKDRLERVADTNSEETLKQNEELRNIRKRKTNFKGEIQH